MAPQTPAERQLTWVVEALRQVAGGASPTAALDFGFREGAEADFEALLRSWCATLAERGQDQLAIWTSPRSPGREVIEGLAAELEPFGLHTTATEPPDAALRGWYVDATSF